MLKKICNKCKQSLSLENFSKNPSRKDGLNCSCRKCSNAYLKEHYGNNKQYYIEKAKDARQERVKWWRELKKGLKCSKCGFNHPAALDFHHTGMKDFGLADALRKGTSKERITEEMKKCEVLCANCHRIEHASEIL